MAGTQEVMDALSWNRGSEKPAEGSVLTQERLPKSVGRTVEAKGKGGSLRWPGDHEPR